MILAAALALEIGAAAPADLKPCAWPTETKFALKTDSNYVAMTHVRRFKAVCEAGGGLLTSFAERGEPIDYTPTPSESQWMPSVVPPAFDEDAVSSAPSSSAGSWPTLASGSWPVMAVGAPLVYVPIPAAPRLKRGFS